MHTFCRIDSYISELIFYEFKFIITMKKISTIGPPRDGAGPGANTAVNQVRKQDGGAEAENVNKNL